MSYGIKYASKFYGPFRDAADSTPSFGDRRTYQMDPANRLEAQRELESDLEEGCDMMIVKPALSYLDIIRDVRNNTNVPVVAYNMEQMVSMKRAGADMMMWNGNEYIDYVLSFGPLILGHSDSSS